MVKERGSSSTKRKLTTSCTACSEGNDVEYVHAILHVPVCGPCNAKLAEAKKNVTTNLYDENDNNPPDKTEQNKHKNNPYCIWCGSGDGCELFMCDSCPLSYCTICVTRNFGKPSSKQVRGLKVWQCYACNPTNQLKTVDSSVSYNSLDKAYSAVRDASPFRMSADHSDLNLEEHLNDKEQKFASLFCSSIGDGAIYFDLQILSDYLVAQDLEVMYRISKNLRKLFQSRVFIIPGLFKTPEGIEYQTRLHPHQIVSLNTMIRMEAEAHTGGRTDRDGGLRGGILGDEPGLGKTVSTIALIAATL
jgi:hypothetical protein